MKFSSRRLYSGPDTDREALKGTRRFYSHKISQWLLAAAVGVGVHMVGLQGVVLAQVQAGQVNTALTSQSFSQLDANFRRSWNDAKAELRNLTTPDTPNPVLNSANGHVRTLVDRLVEISVRAHNSGHPDAAITGLRVARSDEMTGPAGQAYYREMLTAVLNYFGVSGRNPPSLNANDLSDANLNRITSGPINALNASLQAASLAGQFGSAPPAVTLEPEVGHARGAYQDLSEISRLLGARNRTTDDSNPYRYLNAAEARRLLNIVNRIKNSIDDIPGVTGSLPTANPNLNARQRTSRTALLQQYHDLVDGQTGLNATIRLADLRRQGSPAGVQVDTTAIATFTTRADRLRQILVPLSTQTENPAVASAATAVLGILGTQANAQTLLNVSDVNVPGSREYSGNRSRVLDVLIGVTAVISGRTEANVMANVYSGEALAAPSQTPNLSSVSEQVASAQRIIAGDQAFMRNLLTAISTLGYPALVQETTHFPDAETLRDFDRRNPPRAGTRRVYREFRAGQGTISNSREGIQLALGGRGTVLSQYLGSASNITPETFAFFYERFISATDLIHRVSTSWQAGVAVAGSPTPEMMRSYANIAYLFVRPDDAAARLSIDPQLLPSLRSLLGPNTTDEQVYRTLGTNRDFVQVGNVLDIYRTVGYVSQLETPLADANAEARANWVARLRAARVATSFEYGSIFARGLLPNTTPEASPAPRRRRGRAPPAAVETYSPLVRESPVRLERAVMVLENVRNTLGGQTDQNLAAPRRLIEVADAWLNRARSTTPPAATASDTEKQNYVDFCNNLFHLSNQLLALEEANVRLTTAENNRAPNAAALRLSFNAALGHLNEDFAPEHMDVGPTYMPTLAANIADDITRQCAPLLVTVGYAATAFTETRYRVTRTGSGSPSMADSINATVGSATAPGPELRTMRLLELTANTQFTTNPLATATAVWGTSITALDPRFRITSASTVYTLPDVNISPIDQHPPFEPHDQVRYYPYGPTSVELLRQAHQANDNLGSANRIDDTSPLLRGYALRTPLALVPNLSSGARPYSAGVLMMDAASVSDVEVGTDVTVQQRTRAANIVLTNLLRVRTAQLAQRLRERLPEGHPAYANAGQSATIGDLEYHGQAAEALHYRIRRARETLVWAQDALNGVYTTSADHDLSVAGTAPRSLRQAVAAVERVFADLSNEHVNEIPFVPRPRLEITQDPWVEVLERYNLEFVRWDSRETTNDEGDRIVLAEAFVRPRNSPNSEPISLLDWIRNHPRSDPRDHQNDMAVVRREFSRAATMYVAFNAVVGSEYMLLGRNSGSTYVGHLVRGVTMNVGGRSQTVDAYVAVEPTRGGPILGGYREVSDNGRPRVLFYLRRDAIDQNGTLEPIITDDGSLNRNFNTLFNSSPASAPNISTLFVEGVEFRPIAFIQRNRDDQGSRTR
ncbi:MAG: hypothetical protein ACP5N9_00785 [Candidatus Bilamarchaeum sp.]